MAASRGEGEMVAEGRGGREGDGSGGIEARSVRAAELNDKREDRDRDRDEKFGPDSAFCSEVFIFGNVRCWTTWTESLY